MPILKTIHTLGPIGTNCEQAAKYYCHKHNMDAEILLHQTLEEALEHVKKDPNESALLGCVVYPKLHQIVFSNLSWLQISDLFIMPTFNMLLAARDPSLSQTTAVTHPAPRRLIEGYGYEITETTSNSEAARLCAEGLYDACITTKPACEKYSLVPINDFGEVPMGFSIHTGK